MNIGRQFLNGNKDLYYWVVSIGIWIWCLAPLFTYLLIICLYFYPYIYSSVWPSIYLYDHLFICVTIYLSVCTSIYLYVHLSIYLFMCVCVHLFIYLFICVYIYLSIQLFTCLFIFLYFLCILIYPSRYPATYLH